MDHSPLAIDEGKEFIVERYSDHVVKYPKLDIFTPERLHSIAIIQNYVAARTPHVLPILAYSDRLVEPIAPGHRLDTFSFEEHALLIQQLMKIKEKIRSLQILAIDVHSKNAFYCPDAQQMTLIDLAHWKWISKPISKHLMT